MTDQGFQQHFLSSHNSYRAMHKVPPLALSSELSASAQRWADHLLAQDRLQHSGCGDGENVFCMSSSSGLSLTGKEPVDAWYSEVKDYNFDKPGFKGETGHFTQVVWKSSTEVGVGMATNGNKAYVVGQYRPSGNITNEGCFEENVLPKD